MRISSKDRHAGTPTPWRVLLVQLERVAVLASKLDLELLELVGTGSSSRLSF